ncbi:MAG: transposase [Gammaproteobacteria bacterium]
MPRKPRFYLPGIPVHIVQRGHSREPVFFENNDYVAYLDWLGEAAQRYGCAIHAYVLMTNHIHLLATPEKQNSISLMMQYIGRFYVPYINHTYGSSGTIWEGRYKASMIHDEEYLLSCMRYIELNPVRAAMVKTPGAYRWSSYRANGRGEANQRVQPHPLYLALGRTRKQRLEAYQALFKVPIYQKEMNNIRSAWQTGTPLGNDYFRKKIEAKLKCKVGQARRGRPSALKGSDPL